MICKTLGEAQAAIARLRGVAPVHVVVLHDDVCTPDVCKCCPWYEINLATPEGLADGERRAAQFYADAPSRRS